MFAFNVIKISVEITRIAVQTIQLCKCSDEHSFEECVCFCPSTPTLTVTVNNATAAIAGRSHTLSCSVSGANFETVTVMYTWKLNVVVTQGPSASNLYNIATDNDPIQVSDAGEVYSCEVTVAGASYWDVSGSFGGSGAATLSVTS